MSERSGDGSSRHPVNDPAFWRELQETFADALELLQQLAEAQGIEVDAPIDAEIQEHEQLVDEKAREHPLSRSASEYAERVNRWFGRVKSMIHAWGREAAMAAEFDAVTPELEQQVADLQEAVQEIADQRYRIHLKILRAVRERARTGSPVLSPIGDSGNASAAAAMEAIERSIEMWMRIREFFPEEEDAVLNVLVHLQNLREALDREFPEMGSAQGAR